MRYFIIAGEASGDLHGANLMEAMVAKDPEAEFCFLGGDKMATVGGVPVIHYREMAFMGFTAVIRNARTIRNNFKRCKEALVAFQPDALILIDYPSFNLRIAKYAYQQLSCKIYYYIPPKIWAWKTFRIKQIKRYIDKVYTIFPFETEFYRKYDYQVNFVGNPTVDSIRKQLPERENFSQFIFENQLPDLPIIALLPGSRQQEIKSCLPKMITAAMNISHHQIVICAAPGIDDAFYAPFVQESVKILREKTYPLVAQATVAIVNSGTATLETALLRCPQVVVYAVSLGRIARVLKSLILKIPHISLVNLIAGKEVVKELIADLFTVENVKKELKNILFDSNYTQKMLRHYQEIDDNLGNRSAATTCATDIVENLK